MGAPVKSLADCHRSFNQSDVEGDVTTEGGPRLPLTDADTADYKIMITYQNNKY